MQICCSQCKHWTNERSGASTDGRWFFKCGRVVDVSLLAAGERAKVKAFTSTGDGNADLYTHHDYGCTLGEAF